MRPQANRAASVRRITAGVPAGLPAKNTQHIDVPVLFGFALRRNIG